jgi:hypothetical protein
MLKPAMGEVPSIFRGRRRKEAPYFLKFEPPHVLVITHIFFALVLVFLISKLQCV